jgi:hypothetical protein
MPGPQLERIQMTGTAQAPILTTPDDRIIVIERTFDAPRDQVWRAWTEPSLIAQWWGRGRKTVVEQMEVRRGGHWHFVVDGKSGTQGFRGRIARSRRPAGSYGRWNGTACRAMSRSIP